MAELPPLHQEILVNATQALAAMAQVITGLEEVGVAAQTTAAEVTASTGMMGGMFKGVAILAGVAAIAHELKGAKDEAMALEEATSALNTVMDNQKSISEEDKKAVKERTEAYTQLGFAHSDTTQAMANLIAATGSVSQANKLSGITADYARARHMSMAEAATIMARATTGNMKAFKAYGITLDSTLPKNKAIAKAFDELNSKIGGTAKNSVNTLAVQIKILEEKFQGLINKIATAVGPILVFLVDRLKDAVDWIQKNADFLKIYGAAILLIVTYLKLIALWETIVNAENPFMLIVAGVVALGVALAWLWNHLTIFRETLAETLATFIQLLGYIVGGFATLARLMAAVSGNKWLKGVADDADKIAVSIGKAAKSVNDMKNSKITVPKVPKLSDFVTPGGSLGIQGHADLGKGKGGSGSGTVQYVTVYASNTNDIANKLSKSAKHGQPIGATS
jgi:hypothetical protein